MEDVSFYIAEINGKLDTKINRNKKELIQAFTTGRFRWLEQHEVKIYYVDLADNTTEEVAWEEIQKKKESNKIRRDEYKRRQENKRIEKQIEILSSKIRH